MEAPIWSAPFAVALEVPIRPQAARREARAGYFFFLALVFLATFFVAAAFFAFFAFFAMSSSRSGNLMSVQMPLIDTHINRMTQIS
jgi:hypothetical protein